MGCHRLAIILGDCLFSDHQALEPDSETLFFMAEDHQLCTHYRYHKHKLVLFLSAMRSHADFLRSRWSLVYHQLVKATKATTYFDKLLQTVQEYDIQRLVTYEIQDHFFEGSMKQFCKIHGLSIDIKPSPGFLTSRQQFQDYLLQVKKPFMHTFYQRQRRRLGVLIDEAGKPLHGQWSFDQDNRKKLPKGIEIPKRPEIEQTAHTEKVKTLVDELFPDHPGITANFNWSTTRKDVLKEWSWFLSLRFEQFGPYEDAIDARDPFLFHSVLSPYLNMGLITPSELLDEALVFASENEVHFPSLEGFVRQLIGWREFIRGMYHEFDHDLRGNYFDHQRKLSLCWYDGTTGIPVLDDSINKAQQYGFTHHIERLMVLGNLMLLCEIHPDEVNRWFMEMFVDSADWVMVPNVYGMSQFADGGLFATKPYIGGGNYIQKMSHYPKGEWIETMNGLYWRFVAKNRPVFEQNPRMSMMTRTLDKMKDDKREKIFKLANQFIERVTC